MAADGLGTDDGGGTGLVTTGVDTAGVHPPMGPMPPLRQPAMAPDAFPTWWEWRRPLERDAPMMVIIAVALTGAVALFCWRIGELGIGYTITGLCALAAVIATAPQDYLRRDRRYRVITLVGIVGLLLIPTLRAADWLGMLSLFVAFAAALLLFVEAHTLTGLWVGAIAPAFAPFRGVLWMFRRSMRPTRRFGSKQAAQVGVVAVVTILLLLVFGALFAGADSRFKALFEFRFDTSISGEWIGSVCCGLLAGAAVAGGAFLVGSGAVYPQRTHRRAPLWMWATPVGALLIMFVMFLVVQAGSLFRGNDFITDPDGPTYAEYAREGFWQLVIVTIGVIGVLMVGWYYADAHRGTDRLVMRLLLGGLGVATLGVAASAFHRVLLYINAYGATTERIFGIFSEIYLVLILVTLLSTGITMSAARVVHTTVIVTVFATLAFGLANPDRIVAAVNVDRFADSGKIDLPNLADLSPDARSEILRLPPEQRDCVLAAMAFRAGADEPWQSFDISSHRLRSASGNLSFDATCW